MNAIDRALAGAQPLARLASLAVRDGWMVEVTWAGREDDAPAMIDLSPAIFRYRHYRPLRDDASLFRTAHLIENGSVIAWGDGDIDMSASLVARLAQAKPLDAATP